MNFRTMTDVGKRRKGNEDFLFAEDSECGLLPNLFIIADGMGGHNAGEVASKLCVETVVSFIKESGISDVSENLKAAVSLANEIVIQKASSEPELSGMGTTVVVATITKREIIIASVGDSRLYIKRGLEMEQVTKDHTVVAEMLRVGSISKPEAKRHPRRHMLTRAIGAEKNVKVDITKVKRIGNEQILIATDGLTNMVEDDVISGVLSGNEDIDTKSSELLSDALKNGGDDNISFILIDLKE